MATSSPAPPARPARHQSPGTRSRPQPSVLPARSQVPTALSGYIVEKKIGKGQFSIVYRARIGKDGPAVALKRIHLYDMVDEKTKSDCLREIDLLTTLDHPNVISCLASFIEKNELLIVLEMAEAGDLARLVQDHRNRKQLIPEKSVWNYFEQICRGLNHMHERRIMHRDIKPANVFINAQGVVKLGDLGLGRLFSSMTKAAHSLVGTPYYMSPERIHESHYDFKSDIWSLGCVLYELAALRSPFYGEKMTLFSLIQKIELLEYPPLPSDTYSDDLSNLISSMIQIDPQKRPDIGPIYEVARANVNKHAAAAAAAAASAPGTKPSDPQPTAKSDKTASIM